MGELVLEVHVQGGREAGLWLEEVGAKRRISLPDAFWRAFSEALREAGEGALASQVEAALQALVAVRRREEAKRRCMDLVYSPEEYRRCQELIREELGGQSPPAGGPA